MKTVFTTLSVIFGVIFSHSVLAQDVTIYYTNDIHAHVNPAKIIAVDKNRLIGGMANIAGIVNEAKKKSKDVFFFDAGGNDSNLLIVFYVQIMPDDLVMQLHRF
ncbi:hypothetical protein G756_04289 [Escherichia coli HVH 95 (4-6074464)]|nr:hypothetical protein G756_04289 [Escherichia coli HVH 95 (4-6074464)]